MHPQTHAAADVMQELTHPTPSREAAPCWLYSRRSLLRGSLKAASALAMPLQLLGCGAAKATQLPYSPDYGPLAPVADGSTGLALLQLPAGFRYWSFGWTGDVMTDGVATPGSHDGMAVVAHDRQRLVLVRNHEQGNNNGSFAPAARSYDPQANGGTTHLVFAPGTGQWLASWASLGGTLRNCAGGPTPWNSWLSCEETSDGPHNGFSRQHGWVFEVPAFGNAQPEPLTGLGAFRHEACAVDPATGIIYETEDSLPSGFYRFVPEQRGRPALGGRLQMMKLKGQANARLTAQGRAAAYIDTGRGAAPGTTWDVEWVDIYDPTALFLPGTEIYGGVVLQGLLQGASSIVRGEGAWYGNGLIYVCSTSGGEAACGQLFAYDPRRETFTLIFESPGTGVLDHPDNIAWSPRGSLVLCEDGENTPQRLQGLTPEGQLFPFCANNLDFTPSGLGSYTRPSGRSFAEDWRDGEFAGACFEGPWLFFNIQSPGITFAVTGPWSDGAL
ncbi:PhoX family protein [Aquabacterium sp. A7-Y]|uniref:alkaline phosphatase PhoX n=1 Tax=Aquabacterium sp. A7-Y TaxID=1349605 RepID=UPI00223D6042|nr:alkaline phosphatase PhoX [Aquabacterium sp. A7-Y]MCW7539946.1 PhoX family protein [Aquabacterium sp. A7-Y]